MSDETKEKELNDRTDAINYSITLREEEIDTLLSRVSALETEIDGLLTKLDIVEEEKELLYALDN